jgi:hypothetical protein
MAGHLAFYFFYGSIHSYLSVMRIGALASAAGATTTRAPHFTTGSSIGAARLRGGTLNCLEVRVPFACRRRRALGRILDPARMQ